MSDGKYMSVLRTRCDRTYGTYVIFSR